MVPYSCLETVCIELAPTKKKKKKKKKAHWASSIFVPSSTSGSGSTLASLAQALPVRPLLQRSEMASTGNKLRPLGAHHHQPLCTRTHQIGALFLVITTFFFTRLLDQSSTSCNISVDAVHNSKDLLLGGAQSWPERGYGTQLSLKIYVYDVEEIDGLKALLYGRDGKITEKVCLKGQWGTQVIAFCNSTEELILGSAYPYLPHIAIFKVGNGV